jgi:hypothetical protein
MELYLHYPIRLHGILLIEDKGQFTVYLLQLSEVGYGYVTGLNFFSIRSIARFCGYFNEPSDSIKAREFLNGWLSSVHKVLASWKLIVCGCSNETRSTFHEASVILVSCLAYILRPNMGAKFSSETSADFHRTIRRYIPEDRTLHGNRCDNLKSN